MDAPSPSAGAFAPGTMETEAPGMGEDNDSPQEEQEEQQTPIRALLEQINIAEKLSEEKLTEIGMEVSRGFDTDLETRSDWETNVDEWTKLAIQTKEEKTYPWPKASNIKYPLLSTAAMQFAARAYPSLIPSDGQVVKAQVIGKDPTGEKQKRAERTSIYASYQLMHEMDSWEEDMDKLLIMLPVVGTMFKKTYWDSVTEKNCSRLVLPKNLVVNYWTKSLDSCERISEVIEMSPRILQERVNAGIFRDCKLSAPPMPQNFNTANTNLPNQDDTTPYTIIEQHTFLDLDDDGYREPYVVTFQKESRTVLRIVARFDETGITLDKKNKVVRIEPIQYYTKFGFIPNPDGSFYDIGFGVLLGPINDSVNTLINQLVDAGSLSNLQSGFIGKGLRIKMGENRFQPGEWKAVNATADDLKKQIFPLPVKEPSATLFQLMGSLITSGKELASVAEIFTGKSPGQNTPATTTMATIEQGMKVFTAVYKRTYRSLAQEFKKLYRLNEVYLNPQTYVEVMDTTVDPGDFKAEGYDICPGADPSAISQTERLLKAQGLVEMLPMGVLDPLKVVQRVLEAQEQPNWQELIHQETQQTGQPSQQPDPKVLQIQQQAEADQQRFGLEQQKAAFDQQMQGHTAQFNQMMAAQKMQLDSAVAQAKIGTQARADHAKLQAKVAADQMTQNQSLIQNHQTHVQKMTHAEQQHRQKQEQLKSQPKQTSKTGNKK
jgi:chaperonin GroES